MLIRLKKLFDIKGYSLFAISVLLVGFGISITMPYLALYCTEVLGMSPGAFGAFIAISSLGSVLVNTLIAKRSDSGLDRKWLIITALLSAALGYASYVLFQNFFILLIIVTVFSGFGAIAMPQIYAYAQESANDSKTDDKTFAISTLRSLVSLGFVIGPLGGTLILAALGYKGLFLGTSAIFLIIALLMFLFLQKRTFQKTTKKKKMMSLKNRLVWQPMIAFIFLFALNAVNSIITPLFIVNEINGTHSDVGLVVSICAGLEIPIMIAFGALSKQISNHTLLIISGFIALSYFSILALSTHSWQLMAAQLLQATFVAIVMGNGLSYFMDLLPDSPGVATSIYYNGTIIGRLLGNFGGGMIAQYVGYRDVFFVCLLISALSIFILWTTKSGNKSHVSIENP
ncbi:sugar efflux transporter [Gracilibacillus massiliensis]|uniref:sugar efflux transporter n=1 Tax=Gracilibacillus massiliensis TaxID=1564956 RepID=UPI00071C8722|nr:sugar efflux transporter [Gracilibacillus massiliensis]